MKTVLIGAVAAALAALGVATAVPAAAAVQVSLSQPGSATVGVQQTLRATVTATGGEIGEGVGTVTFSVNGNSIGTDNVGGQDGTTATVQWTPGSAGTANITASFSGGGSDNTNVSVAQVGTQATISVPSNAGTSTQVSVGATIRSKVGNYVPTGNVTFYTTSGSAVGNAGLDGNGRAILQYTTPASGSSVSLYVVYNGDANAQASNRSSADEIRLTQSAPSVSLVVAQTNYVGSPSQLTARINPASGTGTVDFSANGTNLGRAAVSNGVATVSWTPPSTGKFTIRAQYSGGNGVPAGTAANDVTVTQPLKPDAISVNPAGASGPWPVGSTQGLPNGTGVNLTARSASGQPVTLSVAGPCSLSGTTLNVLGVGSPCTLTARTPGGNGYAPGNASWSIVQAAGTQTAGISPTPSGTYSVGTTRVLAPVSARTNLNNPITWRVTSGRPVCKIVQAKGQYRVRFVKRGSCVVQGTAPAVPGQWTPFTDVETYRVR